MSNINSHTTPEAASEAAQLNARLAFEKTAAERAKLAPSDFASLKVDLGQAINTVLAAVPRISGLREQMAALPVDHALIDALQVNTLAAAHAVGLHRAAMVPTEELEAIYQEGLERRAALKSDATNLAVYGLFDRDAVTALKFGTGFRNVAYDLFALVSMFHAAGERIDGRTAALPADLERAETVGNQLLLMTPVRDPRRGVDPEALDNRARSFTLMQRSYEEARRAVEFLRWYEGDAHEIAPSFYGTKGTRRRDDEPEDPPTPPEPGHGATSGNGNGAASGNGNGNGAASGNGNGAASGATHATVVGAVATADNGANPNHTPGMRGGSPFA